MQSEAAEPVVIVRVVWIVPVAVRGTQVPLIIVPGAAVFFLKIPFNLSIHFLTPAT